MLILKKKKFYVVEQIYFFNIQKHCNWSLGSFLWWHIIASITGEKILSLFLVSEQLNQQNHTLDKKKADLGA